VLMLDLRDDNLALFAQALTGRPLESIHASAEWFQRRGLIPVQMAAVPSETAQPIVDWRVAETHNRLIAACPPSRFCAVAVNSAGSTVAYFPII